MSRPSELAGLKVAHDFDEFVEGREVVLTLQDQLILNNGSELNDDLDTLHNVELTENFKVEFYNKLKENIKVTKLERKEKRKKKKKKIYVNIEKKLQNSLTGKYIPFRKETMMRIDLIA